MPISPISTPFDYFQIRPSFAVTPNLILEPCLNLQALVVAGGRDDDGNYLSSVLTLLSDATAWTPLASLPRGLWGARASIVGDNDMLRVNGGQDGPGSFRYEVMMVEIANQNDGYKTMNMIKISICELI